MKFFDIRNKVFKVVTDQAANMKKAFLHETEAAESDEYQKLINELLLNQKNEDVRNRERILREALDKSIEEANHIESSNDSEQSNHTKLAREAALVELILDVSLTEETDPINEHNLNDTFNDPCLTPSLDELVNEFLFDDEISKNKV